MVLHRTGDPRHAGCVRTRRAADPRPVRSTFALKREARRNEVAKPGQRATVPTEIQT
jgi:hypothetical protein